MSRRSVLLGGAAVAISACTDEPRPAPTPTPRPPEPDELLRRDIVVAEQQLLALYAATRAAHPAFGEELAAFEARHRQHATAVESSGPVASAPPPAATPGAASATPGTTPTARPTPTTLPAPVIAADARAALRGLRTAEHAAAEARVLDCLRCEDPALAELVAAIAAGEASNDVLLPTAS